MKIATDNIDDFATGMTALGTSDGGDPYVGKLMVQQVVEEHGPVDLIDPQDMPDDALVIPSAMLGTPIVMVEKAPEGTEALAAFEALETHLGQEAYATMSIKASGLNSAVPIAAAAALGFSLVDADGTGRAFPEVQMVTFTTGGASAAPISIADEEGNSLLASTVSDEYAEAFVHVTSTEMGGAHVIGIYVLSGAEVCERAILDSVSLAHGIGEAIRTTKHRSQDPVETALDLTDGHELFVGKITDVGCRTEGGFAVGEVTLDGIDNCESRTFALDLQNENLVTRDSERGVVASIPDLVTVMDAEMGDPVITERLAYGHRVRVIGIPCSPKWRTEEGFDLVGPVYSDYSTDYEPIRILQQPRHD